MVLNICIFIAALWWARGDRKLSFAISTLFSLALVATITASSYAARFITDIVLGIFVIGWHDYITGSVQVTAMFRQEIILSDGRRFDEAIAHRVAWISIISFITFFCLIGSLVLKVIHSLYPSVGNLLYKLIGSKSQR